MRISLFLFTYLLVFCIVSILFYYAIKGGYKKERKATRVAYKTRSDYPEVKQEHSPSKSSTLSNILCAIIIGAGLSLLFAPFAYIPMNLMASTVTVVNENPGQEDLTMNRYRYLHHIQTIDANDSLVNIRIKFFGHHYIYNDTDYALNVFSVHYGKGKPANLKYFILPHSVGIVEIIPTEINSCPEMKKVRGSSSSSESLIIMKY